MVTVTLVHMASNNEMNPVIPGADVDWDVESVTFDEEPDHGLRDPVVREAWAARLRTWLPERASDVLDLGCGTGSLSLLASGWGHHVTGVDLSPGMVDLARAKLAGRDAVFLVGDAATPPVGEQLFDVLLCRHVLWTLPDPGRVLRHWCGLLRPGGRLVLVEGVGDGEPGRHIRRPAHRASGAPRGGRPGGAALGRLAVVGEGGRGRAVRGGGRPLSEQAF